MRLVLRIKEGVIMISSLHRLAYIDEEGKLKNLPLATESYNPEPVAEELYRKGFKVFIYRYSIQNATWGRDPDPWKPDIHIKKRRTKNLYECDEIPPAVMENIMKDIKHNISLEKIMERNSLYKTYSTKRMLKNLFDKAK
jgi:hypothetical protein